MSVKLFYMQYCLLYCTTYVYRYTLLQQLWLFYVFASTSASEQHSVNRLADIPNFPHLLNSMLPYSSLCRKFLDGYALILSDSSAIFFCVFLLVEAVLGRPLRGRLAMSVFSSLKCLIHRLTLLLLMQLCPYARWSHASICDAEVFSWTGSYITELCWKFMSYSYVADLQYSLPFIRNYVLLIPEYELRVSHLH